MSKLKENVLYEIPEKWFLYVDKLLENIEWYCTENKISLPVILQVKEKYGELRFYYGINEDWTDGDFNRVEMMVEITERICL